MRVFDKRLEKYEKLMELLLAAYEVATDVMENPDHSPELRHQLISAAVLPIAQFADDNELYIDSELAAHCVASFMGAEDVMDIEDPTKREEDRQEIRDMYADAKRMIREDSGISEIDKLFKRMTKLRLSGPVIERIRYLKAHPEEVRRLHKGGEPTSSEHTPDEGS